MSAGRYDIYAERGAKWEKQIAATYNGSIPVDLSSYLPAMHIRPTYDGPLTLELNDTDNFVEMDLANGRFVLRLTAANTRSIAAGRYRYDLELYHSTDADDVIRLLEGYFTISGEITT